MNNWKSKLKSDPINWLMEEDNPSVRYFTLADILEKSESDPDVGKAKNDIMIKGLVPRILAKQKSGGYWGKVEDFYIRSKYKGTVWSFIILAELGVDGKDERIRKACEFILDNSQDPESGGFAYAGTRGDGGAHSAVLPCLTGNMAWGLIRFGYLDDPRVQRGISWITTYQRFDDGIEHAPVGWPYEKHVCWGRHTCHMGVVKALKALAEIPIGKRSKEVRDTIQIGAEHLLKHNIHKRSHDLTRVSKPAWLNFGFPLMWNTDVLEILGILAKLGYRDKRMQEAVDLLVSKQDSQGRWNLDNTFNGRFQLNIERKGQPSKWITLNALRVLKRFYG
nr:nitrogen fixation protein NifH [Candidatus Njordarchaeota archaeon]